jgi:hypothetical protein
MALIALYKTDLVLQPWMTFVAYQAFNILTSAVVMFGNRFIPGINKFACELCWAGCTDNDQLYTNKDSGIPSAGMVCDHGHSRRCSSEAQ